MHSFVQEIAIYLVKIILVLLVILWDFKDSLTEQKTPD